MMSATSLAQETKPNTAEAAAPDKPAAPSFFLWTNTSVTLLPYGWEFEVDPEEQTTISVEHAHESTIGDFFVFIDTTNFHDANGADDLTWYGEVSPRLSLGKLLQTDLSYTFFKQSLFEFKDVLLAAQYERGEDPDVAEAVLLGLGFDLDVREAGLLGRSGVLGSLGQFNYLQVNLYARAELTEGVERGFDDMQVTMVGAYPLEIGRAKFLIDGYFDWVLGLGSEEWSYHLNPQLSLDVGDFWGAPKKFYVGVEVDLWWNKFQIPDSPAFDTDQTAVSLMLKYYF